MTRIINTLQGALIILLFIVNTGLTAQSQNKTNWWKTGWSVNLNGGASLFYGDVENQQYFPTFKDKNEWRPGFGLILQKQLGQTFAIRGQLFNGQLSGSKKQYKYWFEGNVIETSLNVKMDVFSLFAPEPERKLSLYLMAGIGLSHWNTELKKFDSNDILSENGKDHTGSGLFGRTVEGVIPFGGGLEYNLNQSWSMNFELSLRPVNSDKLDAKVGMFKYDFYSYNFIGLSYHFNPKRDKKPELIRKELAEEIIEPPMDDNIVIEEPDIEIEAPEMNVAEVVPPMPPKSIDDKLLDKEYRTGMFESPWPGVEFTVQVAASRTYVDPEQIAKRFKLQGNVLVNEADGWYRYSVGKHIKYWKAREYKNILVSKNKIRDAFVVAYKDDQRIMLSQLIEMDVTAGSQEEQMAKQQRTESKISYSVQVLATTNGNISPNAIREMFEIDGEVIREETDGLFQYTAGIFSTYNDAAKLRNQLKARGISGAFVVGYKDGVRTEIKELVH